MPGPPSTLSVLSPERCRSGSDDRRRIDRGAEGQDCAGDKGVEPYDQSDDLGG